MVAEEKAIIRSKKSGHTREEWQKVTKHTANHFWDCECYALAAAEMVGVRYVQTFSHNIGYKSAVFMDLM
jgi:phage terminase large subunit GpA-like protein